MSHSAKDFLAYAVCYAIWPFSYLMPRSERILAFGAMRGAFSDNPKYLFLWAAQHQPGRKVVWLSADAAAVREVRSIGFEAYRIPSLRGFWYALRAGYWFINCYTSDILFCLAGRTRVVNLWHGVGCKQIEFGITKGVLAKRYVDRDFWECFYHPACFRRPDWFLSTSDFFDGHFSRAFRIGRERCIRAGYPRNMFLTADVASATDFVQRFTHGGEAELVGRIKPFAKVFLYMPTWRESQRDSFTSGFDLPRLNECLREQNAVALMKPHPNTRVDASATFSNLIFVPSAIDIYSILPFTDVLITDYSGILYDYLLMPGKDVILYFYDYDEYVADRELCQPIRGNVAGREVTTFDALFDCIRTGNYAMDEAERARIVSKFWSDTDAATSAETIMKALNLVEKP